MTAKQITESIMRVRGALQEYLANTVGSDIADRELRGSRFVVVTQPAN